VTIHLRPTGALAERALLPEDPGAAMALAQALLERPLMFNHSRGLWGYTGLAADGRPLTVQSTGIGGPSAAVVLEELIALGLRRAVRVGTCAALDPSLALGDLLIGTRALCADGASRSLAGEAWVQGDAGASRSLAGEEWVEGDAGLTAGLRTAAPELQHGLVASADLYYGAADGERRGGADGWPSGVLAVELETAALFALGARRGIPIGCVLAVSDLVSSGERIADEDLAARTERAGRLALAALATA
jgi:uridine phosphorylase